MVTGIIFLGPKWGNVLRGVYQIKVFRLIYVKNLLRFRKKILNIFFAWSKVICLFHTGEAKKTTSPSKRHLKCTNSVDLFPVYPMGMMQFLVPVIWTSAVTATSDLARPELYLFPKLTEASVDPKRMAIPSKTTWNRCAWRTQRPRRTSWRTQETGNGLTELVHLECRFEGEGVFLAPPVWNNQIKL